MSKEAELSLPDGGYRVVPANPPFSGLLDKDRIVDDVKVGTITATELLFVKYMMESLDSRGRCGLVVPEGLLLGSTCGHKEIRRKLLEGYRVDAVLSLPDDRLDRPAQVLEFGFAMRTACFDQRCKLVPLRIRQHLHALLFCHAQYVGQTSRSNRP